GGACCRATEWGHQYRQSPLPEAIEPSKQCQPFIKNRTHDMRRSSVAEQFQRQQRAPGVRCRDLRGTGQASLFQHPVERKAGQVGKKQKDAAEFGSQTTWGKIQLVAIGGRGFRHARPRSLLITTARQACKALLFENHGDGGRAEVSSGLAQCLTDVVDGEVLLAHPYDPFAEWIRFWRGLRALGDWGKKLRV